MKNMWVFTVTSIVLALCFLGIGLRGLLTKRPVTFAGRWLLAVVALGFLPSLFFMADLSRELGSGSLNYLWLFQLVIYGLALAVLWRQTSGYFVFGVSDDYFQVALRAALQKLNLPFEESLARLRLTTLDADLHAAVQPRLGTAQLMFKRAGDSATLKQIAQAMQEYFATVPGKVNRTVHVFYLIFGLLLIAYLIYFQVWLRGLETIVR